MKLHSSHATESFAKTVEVRAWVGDYTPLQWRNNGRDSVSNHQPHDCLLNRLFRRRSTKTPKLRVTGLCAGNSPGTGEFPAQMASNVENVSIWWRHLAIQRYTDVITCVLTLDDMMMVLSMTMTTMLLFVNSVSKIIVLSFCFKRSTLLC